MTSRRILPILILAALTGPMAAQASASPRLAIEPSDPAFRDGSSTSFQISPRGRAALDNGGTSPGQTPASVGLDLRLGPAVTDLLLAEQFKRSRNGKGPLPYSTTDLIALIPKAGAASRSIKDLRANVIRIATAYMKAPTLEDVRKGGGTSNRSRLICAMGSGQSCAERWPWCAIFASTMWRMAGVRAITAPIPAVAGLAQWGIKRDRWHEAVKRVSAKKTVRYQPGAGDIVAYGCNRSRTWCDHTGLVVSANATSLTTIEGNTSTPLKGRDGVAAKVRPRDSWISGFVSLS